tara:strand:+ start:1770 stop:2138 length:369 start_codon:yes stop_codon:yes gene_type:complete
MSKLWSVYVIQTDKNYLKSKKNTYLNETVIKKAVYVGITSKTVEERFLAHNGKIEGLRGLRKKYGKPITILDEFTKKGFKNRFEANDYERYLWNKLKNDPKYITVQKTAPTERGRKKYTDNY